MPERTLPTAAGSTFHLVQPNSFIADTLSQDESWLLHED